jgi:hypothetical protein
MEMPAARGVRARRPVSGGPRRSAPASGSNEAKTIGLRRQGRRRGRSAAGPRSGNVEGVSAMRVDVLVASGREVGDVSVEDDVSRRTKLREDRAHVNGVPCDDRFDARFKQANWFTSS